MTLLALSAATVNIADPTFAGTILPASETSLGSNTGLTFPNTPEGLVVLRVVVGSAGAGNVTFVSTLSTFSSPVTAVANSTVYLFGPFDPAKFSNSAGLVTVNLSVVTGNSAGVYLVPAGAPLAGMRALHNPFEMTAGAQDR